MFKLYVDVDGTLVSSKLDDEFRGLLSECLSRSDAVKAYNELAGSDWDNLCINHRLVRWLRVVHAMGVEIIVWTNRGEEQRDITLRNLGCIKDIVSDWQFRDGQKKKDILDGYVVDNEDRFRGCCADGLFISASVFWNEG